MYLPFSAIPKGSYIYDTAAFITNLSQFKAAVCRIYMIVAVIGNNTVICLCVGANRITCQLIKLFAIHFKDVVCNSHGVCVLLFVYQYRYYTKIQQIVVTTIEKAKYFQIILELFYPIKIQPN